MAVAMPCSEMETAQQEMTMQMPGHMDHAMMNMSMDSHEQQMSS